MNLSNAQNPAAPLVLLGCGAIAEQYYVPALLRAGFSSASLIVVDNSADRLRLMADKYGLTHGKRAMDEVREKVLGVINATPHPHHFATSKPLLEAGIGVLLEKPITPEYAKSAALVELAKQRGVPLLVNNLRRFYPSFRRVREMIEAGELGEIQSLRWTEGVRFEWPTVSGFYFRPHDNEQPRGIVLDVGAHVLDIVCWWMGRRPELVEGRHDGKGGPEAHAALELQSNGAKISVLLSALMKQRNDFEVVGTKGIISGAYNDLNRFKLRDLRNRTERWIDVGSGIRLLDDIADLILKEFMDAVSSGKSPTVSGADVLDSLWLIEEFYASAKPFDMPWYDEWRES